MVMYVELCLHFGERKGNKMENDVSNLVRDFESLSDFSALSYEDGSHQRQVRIVRREQFGSPVDLA